MDNPQGISQHIIGFIFTAITLASGGFAAIAPNVELIVRLGAGGIAIISGLMAIRYYHFATKEKIQALKKAA